MSARPYNRARIASAARPDANDAASVSVEKEGP